MKKLGIIAVALSLSLGCGKRSIEQTPLLLLLQEKARTQYITYLTDENKELLHAMDYIDRNYVRSDTVADKIIHHFVERNQLYRFYVDKEGTLFQEIKVDLAAYALNAGYAYREPAPFTYWKPLFKRSDGFGTSWSLKAQQNFVAYDSLGNPHTLRYTFEGEATLAGWADIIVPANRGNVMKTLHVRWKHFSSTLFDLTDDRMAWEQKGEAADYFDPEVGLLRSIVDYTFRKGAGEEQIRKSTFELYLLIAGSESQQRSKSQERSKSDGSGQNKKTVS